MNVPLYLGLCGLVGLIGGGYLSFRWYAELDGRDDDSGVKW